MSLYPEIDPFNEFLFPVSDLHSVWVEQCGDPQGKPVLFIHGGPGGGIDPVDRRFFHPEKYHIILVDQRGCGRSIPHAELEENNTQALVSDFEAIRAHLGIPQWMLFGGSWGSTLGITYAQAHPECVTELILRGIYLAAAEESHWLFGGGGADRIFPQFWESFVSWIPEEERDDLIGAYYRRLTGADKVMQKKSG